MEKKITPLSRGKQGVKFCPRHREGIPGAPRRREAGKNKIL